MQSDREGPNKQMESEQKVDEHHIHHLQIEIQFES